MSRNCVRDIDVVQPQTRVRGLNSHVAALQDKCALAKTGAGAYSRAMALMDKIKKWLGMGKKKA
jgi:hypothetical protein